MVYTRRNMFTNANSELARTCIQYKLFQNTCTRVTPKHSYAHKNLTNPVPLSTRYYMHTRVYIWEYGDYTIDEHRNLCFFQCCREARSFCAVCCYFVAAWSLNQFGSVSAEKKLIRLGRSNSIDLTIFRPLTSFPLLEISTSAALNFMSNIKMLVYV